MAVRCQTRSYPAFLAASSRECSRRSWRRCPAARPRAPFPLLRMSRPGSSRSPHPSVRNRMDDRTGKRVSDHGSLSDEVFEWCEPLAAVNATSQLLAHARAATLRARHLPTSIHQAGTGPRGSFRHAHPGPSRFERPQPPARREDGGRAVATRAVASRSSRPVVEITVSARARGAALGPTTGRETVPAGNSGERSYLRGPRRRATCAGVP